jgi:hypothetical protein
LLGSFVEIFFKKRFLCEKQPFLLINKVYKRKSLAQKNFICKKCFFFKKKLFFMTISSPEREAKKVKIAVDRNPVETSFERWACDLKKG